MTAGGPLDDFVSELRFLWSLEPDDGPDDEGPDVGDREPRRPMPSPPSLEATADED